MKKLLAIIVLSLCFTTPCQANDIRDIQIEGISIGDNAIDYFSKSVLNVSTIEIEGTDKKISFAPIYDKRFKKYENISNFNYESFDLIEIYFLSNDRNYKILGLAGGLSKNYGNRFKTEKECIKKKDEIYSDIKPLFKEAKISNSTTYHPLDKTKKSKFHRTSLKLKPDSKFHEVEITCVYYKGEMSKIRESTAGIALFSNEFIEWKTKQKIFKPQ